jgi:hypothetical protein
MPTAGEDLKPVVQAEVRRYWNLLLYLSFKCKAKKDTFIPADR